MKYLSSMSRAAKSFSKRTRVLLLLLLLLLLLVAYCFRSELTPTTWKVTSEHLATLKAKLKDPESLKVIRQKVQFAGIAKDFERSVPKFVENAEIYCGIVYYNAKNSFGGYGGEDVDIAQFAYFPKTHNVIRIDASIASGFFNTPSIGSDAFFKCDADRAAAQAP